MGRYGSMIRLATADDATQIAEIYRPAVETNATSFEATAPDSTEMARRIVTTIQRFPWLVADEAGFVRSYAYASAHRDRTAYQWSVEVSAYVRSGAQRQGTARALYTSLFAILALQGFRNAYAGITLPNHASVGFHMAMGFTRVGVFKGIGYKHGAWHDVAWFERALRAHDIEPDCPQPLAEISATSEFAAAVRAGDGRQATES